MTRVRKDSFEFLTVCLDSHLAVVAGHDSVLGGGTDGAAHPLGLVGESFATWRKVKQMNGELVDNSAPLIVNTNVNCLSH